MTLKTILARGVSATGLAVALALAAPVAAPAFAQDAAPAAAAQTPPYDAWGVEQTDVVADPAIRYGRLANGMKYAIRPNDTPPGAASFRLLFDFGSVGEMENERGLAHFIEHMAFNGSTNVPEGEMIPLLERLGLSFGPDTNASTGFDETTYMLDVPNVTDESVSTALMLMRETASELTFAPESVDREREVIVGERRLRDTVGLRALVDQIEFTLPDTLLPNRLPIGLDSVLRDAPAERLKALYHRYYRPENAALVVVGDIDPDQIEAQIADRFGDWQGVGTAGERPDLGDVDLDRPLSFDTFVDPAATSGVSIFVARDYTDPVDTVATRYQDELDYLASAMLNRRISRIASQPDSPISGGGMGVSKFDDLIDYTSLSVQTRDGAWKQGLDIAEQELRRAKQYGFTQAELDYALSNSEANERRAAEQAEARTNRQIAGQIVNAANENDVIVDPAWHYAMFQSYKDRLTLDAVNARFRELWSGSEPLVQVSAKQLDGGVDAVEQAWNASTEVAVAEPTDFEANAFAYESFGDGVPGEVVSDTMIEDLGIRTITFDNNVRLNIKQTDFEPGRVRYSIRTPGGQFAFGDNQVASSIYLSIASAVGGLGQNSYDELQQLTAGKQIGTGFSADTDAFVASGTTTPDDLAMQMKVSAAYLTDPGFRPEADARFSGVIDAVWQQLLSQPAQLFSLSSGGLVSDDPRFQMPTLEQLGAVRGADLRQSFAEATANGALEIGIVGDIDPDTAIAAVANSFGELPDRALDFPDYADMRAVAFKPASDEPVTIVHTGQADQALVGSIWRTRDDSDYREAVGLGLLQQLVQLKALAKLREEIAATYSPLVSENTSSDFTDYGTLSVAAVVAPEEVDEVQDLIPAIAAELRDAPVDDDLLLRARQPVIEGIRTSREQNGFWLGVVADAQSEADRLDRVRNQLETVESFTPAELQALAQEYLTDDRRADVRIISDKAEQAGG
ncbi:M16 family metallopeptidase [Aurantiacibacter spongiae]|uniref:Insulinase family protein n=1 Tax=Aurantiacibacter spongiae TaxID=2488860 RepID=A0A3N5DP52_9SPHN|nr:M16 family metallopeptidase [Aurantiacibacter spongiae]RPF70881.1 insulinase family protein [Aurantiacibacter spongiae]